MTPDFQEKPRLELDGFTARLNGLLDVAENATVSPPAPWSVATLRASMEGFGASISVGQLSNLRAGKTLNPGGAYLHAIAQALGVTPLVWFDHDSYLAEVDRLARVRDARRGHELGR